MLIDKIVSIIVDSSTTIRFSAANGDIIRMSKIMNNLNLLTKTQHQRFGTNNSRGIGGLCRLKDFDFTVTFYKGADYLSLYGKTVKVEVLFNGVSTLLFKGKITACKKSKFTEMTFSCEGILSSSSSKIVNESLDSNTTQPFILGGGTGLMLKLFKEEKDGAVIIKVPNNVTVKKVFIKDKNANLFYNITTPFSVQGNYLYFQGSYLSSLQTEITKDDTTVVVKDAGLMAVKRESWYDPVAMPELMLSHILQPNPTQMILFSWVSQTEFDGNIYDIFAVRADTYTKFKMLGIFAEDAAIGWDFYDKATSAFAGFAKESLFWQDPAIDLQFFMAYPEVQEAVGSKLGTWYEHLNYYSRRANATGDFNTEQINYPNKSLSPNFFQHIVMGSSYKTTLTIDKEEILVCGAHYETDNRVVLKVIRGWDKTKAMPHKQGDMVKFKSSGNRDMVKVDIITKPKGFKFLSETVSLENVVMNSDGYMTEFKIKTLPISLLNKILIPDWYIPDLEGNITYFGFNAKESTFEVPDQFKQRGAIKFPLTQAVPPGEVVYSWGNFVHMFASSSLEIDDTTIVDPANPFVYSGLASASINTRFMFDRNWVYNTRWMLGSKEFPYVNEGKTNINKFFLGRLRKYPSNNVSDSDLKQYAEIKDQRQNVALDLRTVAAHYALDAGDELAYTKQTVYSMKELKDPAFIIGFNIASDYEWWQDRFQMLGDGHGAKYWDKVNGVKIPKDYYRSFPFTDTRFFPSKTGVADFNSNVILTVKEPELRINLDIEIKDNDFYAEVQSSVQDNVLLDSYYLGSNAEFCVRDGIVFAKSDTISLITFKILPTGKLSVVAGPLVYPLINIETRLYEQNEFIVSMRFLTHVFFCAKAFTKDGTEAGYNESYTFNGKLVGVSVDEWGDFAILLNNGSLKIYKRASLEGLNPVLVIKEMLINKDLGNIPITSLDLNSFTDAFNKCTSQKCNVIIPNDVNLSTHLDDVCKEHGLVLYESLEGLVSIFKVDIFPDEDKILTLSDDDILFDSKGTPLFTEEMTDLEYLATKYNVKFSYVEDVPRKQYKVSYENDSAVEFASIKPIVAEAKKYLPDDETVVDLELRTVPDLETAKKSLRAKAVFHNKPTRLLKISCPLTTNLTLGSWVRLESIPTWLTDTDDRFVYLVMDVAIDVENDIKEYTLYEFNQNPFYFDIFETYSDVEDYQETFEDEEEIIESWEELE